MRYALVLLAAAVLGFGSFSARAEDAPPAPAVPAPAASASAPAAATPSRTFSDAERAEIEDIVKNYLTKDHPEIIMEAAQALQKRDSLESETHSAAAIARDKDKLYNDPNTPSGGEPKGDVTVVEFFDYQCGYCKMAEPGIEKLLREDKKVRFLYKEYPILGPASLEAAKASIASMKQGKFLKFHEALINKKDHVSDEIIAQAAREAGLDIARMKKDAADPATQQAIDDSLKLGSDIGVRGTPMFIINGQIYPGAMQYEQLKDAVATARGGGKKP